MHGWQQLVGAIGGFAAVVGAIAWLIRTLFENMLKSSLADHQAQLASASSIQIERFKADLANAAAERKFHFEKLHEKRLEALADLHERCVNLGASLAFLQYQLDRRDRDPIQPETIQKSIDDLVQQYSDANRLFRAHRLYLSRDLATKIDQTMAKPIGALLDLKGAESQSEGDMIARYSAALDDWKNNESAKFGTAVNSLEEEFRYLLGSDKGEGVVKVDDTSRPSA